MSLLNTIQLSYSSDLIPFYEKLSTLTGFILLESIEKTVHRYDIVTALPYDEWQISSSEGAASTLAAQIQNRIGHCESQSSLPFQGGAVGFFTYDLACQLNAIPYQSLADLQSLPLAYLGFYDWGIIADHLQRTVCLFYRKKGSMTGGKIKEIIDLWQAVSDKIPQTSFQLAECFTPLCSKEYYEQSYASVQAALTAGRCYQANLTQHYVAAYQGDLFQAYKKIRRKNPVGYAAYLNHHDLTVLSFSPERFITYDQQQIITSPIKGTAKRHDDEKRDQEIQQWLLNCPKNRAENVMIVDLLRNDLGKIARTGSVTVDKLCRLESYQGIHHLVSHISATVLDDHSMMDVFLSCFPGGSITGAPKLEAMKLISEIEPYGRGLYCGCLGYFSSHGRFDTNIAIRTVVANKNKMYISAGSGIVIHSELEKEYEECWLKIKPIYESLVYD